METRQCVVCKQTKSITEFNVRRRVTGERHTHCRDCQRIYKRNFYLRNREHYLQRPAQEKEERIQRNRERIREYLSKHACVDCGESDIIVLEFDHVGKKDRPIADMVLAGISWEKILKEIQKCEVRCGNCHKKKTAQERKWYQFLGP